jgi:hypothetical protein
MRLIQQRTDEGIFLSGAVRIVHGQVFARDFFEMMGPGTFYWLAGFFKVFGVTFFATRVLLFLSSLGTCLAIYYLTRRICDKYHFLPCVIVIGTYYGSIWPAISHHTESNFVALAALICIVQWQAHRKSGWLFAAGMLAGIATCIFQHKGVLLLCAILLWLWIQYRRKLVSLGSLALAGAGYFSAILPMLVYFLSQKALGSLIYANLVWPVAHYETVNVVSYAHGIIQDYWSHWVQGGSSFIWTVAMASILIVPFVFVAVLPVLLTVLALRHGARRATPEILLYWICGAALWISELQRKDIGHLAFGSPILIILAVYYLSEIRKSLAGHALQILSISAVCLATFNLVLVLMAQSVTTRIGTVGMFGPDPVLKVLDEHISPGEKLFIYPYCPTYYFLSSSMNPTRYSVLYNGNSTSQYQEVIQVLNQQRVRNVLWDTNFEAKTIPANFPGATRMTPGRLLFESYLDSHYKLVTEVNGFRLMERVGGGQPN